MPHFLSDLLGVIKPKGLKVWAILCSTYGKNSHILPTGQWYAPSAVINDALIDNQ